MLEEEGGTPELVSLESGEIQGFNHLDKGDTFEVDRTVDDADESDYDVLVLPGGVANPDFLRMNENAVRFARPAATGSTRRWLSTTGSSPTAGPDDLPAFCDKLAEEICEGRHEEQAASTR